MGIGEAGGPLGKPPESLLPEKELIRDGAPHRWRSRW